MEINGNEKTWHNLCGDSALCRQKQKENRNILLWVTNIMNISVFKRFSLKTWKILVMLIVCAPMTFQNKSGSDTVAIAAQGKANDGIF